MTKQDLINNIEWVNQRCSLHREPLTKMQKELLMFVFSGNLVNTTPQQLDINNIINQKDMVTEKQYLEAQEIVKAYNEQLKPAFFIGGDNVRYNWGLLRKSFPTCESDDGINPKQEMTFNESDLEFMFNEGIAYEPKENACKNSILKLKASKINN